MKLFRKKIITRKSDTGKEPYMIRWNIFQCHWFSIKIHRILLSDDDCMHDHPWTFISFILKGGYVEETPGAAKKLYGPGSVLYRPAKFIHRLEIFQPAVTLVINFRKTKSWGFFTPKGFVEWFNYTKNHCE
jgi:hypothetical protein